MIVPTPKPDDERSGDAPVPESWRRTLKLVLTTLLTLTVLTATTAHAASSPLAPVVKQTNDCRVALGLKPLPVSSRKWRDDRYDKWRLTVWKERKQAYCSIVRAANRDVQVALRLFHPCISQIVHIETGGTYSVTATNRSSGAYGLPQALPGTKMASEGADWRTSPLIQLRWMQKYVNARYGGPCEALHAHRQKGWY